jgi:hypothetical protein
MDVVLLLALVFIHATSAGNIQESAGSTQESNSRSLAAKWPAFRPSHHELKMLWKPVKSGQPKPLLSATQHLVAQRISR